MKKLLTAFAATVVTALSVSSVPAFSAGEPMDFTGDDRVDVFDLICARKEKPEAEKLKLMADFLLGNGNGYTENTTDNPDDNRGNNWDKNYTIDESCILEPKGTVHSGDGTYYGGGYVGGCAMLDPVSTDYWIVAMNLADYNDGQLAGAYLEVTGELGTINMLVTDLLPEGKKGDLDLYVDAFPLVAPAIKGRVPVSWKIVPLDTAENAPVCYKYKEGTTEFWCGVQVRNHRYPITKLEYLKDGEFVEIKRRPYNYFESMEMGKGPFTFRITDIYGQVIIDENIPLSYDDSEIIQGHVQFPK